MLMFLASSILVTAWMTFPSVVQGHGRLMDPPARNSMWRLGFPNPVNYNDNELYCGGRMTQWARNNGKCGVCGDPHHAKREHEAGGKYANGIITREYKQGDVIDVAVHVTANHKGFFEFRICPVEDPKVEVTQECLDKIVLEKADGNGTKYFLPESQSNQFFNVSLRLPSDLTCKQCVIQWKYRTGNTWDKDETGKFCVGCGPQEEFYNCADVTIHGKSVPNSTRNTKQEKPIGDTKKSAILFSNDDSDKGYYNAVAKPGDFSAQKGKLMKESSKYSVLSTDGNAVFQKKESNPTENQIIIQALKKMNSPTSMFNSERFSLLDTLSKGWGAPTGPSFVPYRWQAGVPKQSEADEIRRRFAYNIGGSQLGKSVARNPSDDMINKKVYQRTSPLTTTSQGLIENKSEGIDEADKSFLRKWKLMKMKHVAAQEALKKPGLSRSQPRQGNDIKTQKFQKNLQSMRENSKGRNSLSHSPFSPINWNKNRNSSPTEQETVRAKTVEEKFPAQQTSQKTTKKRLPSWLVTALKIKVNADQEKSTAQSEQNDSAHLNDFDFSAKGSKVNDIYSKKSQDLDKDKDSALHSFGEKGFKSKSQRKTESNSVARSEKREDSVYSNTKYTREQPMNSYQQHDKQSTMSENSDGKNAMQSEEGDSNLNKEDTESLVRYIIATLLARKNKAGDDVDSESSGQDFSDKSLLENADQPQFGDLSSPWFTPKSNSGSLLKLTQNKESSRSDSSARLPGFMSAVTNSNKVQSQSYNGFMFGSNRGFHQGYTSGSAKPQESRQVVWTSNDAKDNSAAMEAYKMSLNKLYGNMDTKRNEYRHDSKHSQSVAYQSPLSNRGVISTYQASSQPQHYTNWVSSDSATTEGDFVHDPNHVWAMRANKRQSHYQQPPQQQPEAQQLVCKALVAFGGGMDRWCTDNCNANFCPNTICVCKRQDPVPIPILSSYSADDNVVEKNNDWEMHIPMKKTHPVARASHVTRDTPFYNPLLQSYATSSQYNPNFDLNQRRKPHSTAFNAFLTNPRLSPLPTHAPFDSYSRFSSKTVSEKGPSRRLGESSRQYVQIDTYRNKNLAARDDVEHIFGQSANAVVSSDYNSGTRKGNWYSHKNVYPMEEASSSLNPNGNLITPERVPFSLPSRTDLRSSSGNFVGNQFPDSSLSERVGAEVSPMSQMRCRAVGAYRGLDHFDEWCESTCFSSMCPLLMCECDD
ncbi:cell wall integrity and stress response component 4 [Biomphalaria glabrata]|nr:solute carrier family 25 (mitochondrial carrier protein); member 16 [Biomphalaria glabrata]